MARFLEVEEKLTGNKELDPSEEIVTPRARKMTLSVRGGR
jgi:hypothetical protein